MKVSHREKKELPTDSHPRQTEAQQAFSHELKPEESQSIQLELFLLLSQQVITINIHSLEAWSLLPGATPKEKKEVLLNSRLR